MTYKELMMLIKENPDQWDNTVSLLDNFIGEYLELRGFNFATENNDVLDNGHLFLIIDNGESPDTLTEKEY